MENFDKTLDVLSALNKEHNIFVPSLNRQIKFKGLTTKQQKDVVKSALDKNVAGISFVNLLCDIINDCSLEKGINFLITDRSYIISSLRAVCLSPVVTVSGEKKDISFVLNNHIPLPADLKIKTIEDGALKIHLSIPNFKTEVEINDESKKLVTSLENKEELTKETIGEMYVNELIKYINRIEFNSGSNTVDINFNEITFNQKKQLVEKLPLTSNTLILSYINETKQFEQKFFTLNGNLVEFSIDASFFTV